MKPQTKEILSKYINLATVEYTNHGKGDVDIRLGNDLEIASAVAVFGLIAEKRGNTLTVSPKFARFVPTNKQVETLAKALQELALFRCRKRKGRGFRFFLSKTRPKFSPLIRGEFYQCKRIDKKELKKYF